MTRRADLATSRDPAFSRPHLPGEFEGPEYDDEWDSEDSNAYQDEQEKRQ